MATGPSKTQPDELLSEQASATWQRVVKHTQGAPSPLKALVKELAQSDAARYAIPNTSHFTPWFYAVEYGEHVADIDSVPVVAAEYWGQVDKFRIHFRRFQGVPYDQKWCELPEAIATLKYALRHLNADGSG